jgi:multimeric flavodoxin WrbA
MKVVGISCSPRKGGNTETLVIEALKEASALGAETTFYTVADRNLSFCDGCDACRKTAECKINDGATEILESIMSVDGIIIGSPVYFWNVSAQAKTLIDRSYAYREGRKLKNKIAGAIVVGRRAGCSNAYLTLNTWFGIHRMIPAVSALSYRPGEEIKATDRGGGAIAYGGEKGEALNDKQGLTEARAVGTAIVNTFNTYRRGGLL